MAQLMEVNGTFSKFEKSLQEDLAKFLNQFYEDPNNIRPKELLIAEKNR